MKWKNQTFGLTICVILLSLNGVASVNTDTFDIALDFDAFDSGALSVSSYAEENIALNPDRTGYPHPTESDKGWGGGSDKWEIVDGNRIYPEWYHGLAFTGGNNNWAGEPCGIRQATINFGELKTFEKVIIWHHGHDHIPMLTNLDYWDGSNWIAISFIRDINLTYLPPPGYYHGTPDTLTFDPVTGSKVKYSFDNCGNNILETPIVHGWIYEFEVWSKLSEPTVNVTTDKTVYTPGEKVLLNIKINNPTKNTYFSTFLLNVQWPNGKGMNALTKSFSMGPGFSVVKVFPIPIPDSIFVSDGDYKFAASLIYDSSITTDSATITIKRP